MDAGQHAGPVELLQVAADRGRADAEVTGAGRSTDDDPAGTQVAQDVDLPPVPHSAKIAVIPTHFHASTRRYAHFCALLCCQGGRRAGTMAASPAPSRGVPPVPAIARVPVRPAGRPTGAGRPGVRRLPVRAPSSSTSSSPGWTSCRRTAPRSGPTGWAPAPGASPTWRSPASRLGLRTSLAAAFGDDVYGDFCWRTAGRAGARRPAALPPVRAAGTRRSPSRWRSTEDRTHGHPRPRAAGAGDRAARRPPRSRAVFVDLDLADRSAAATGSTWADRPAPRAPWSSPTSAGTPPAPGPAEVLDQLSALPRVHAQRGRGDGLHPHRHPARRPLRPRRPGPARRRHRRRAGALAIDGDHRRGGRRAGPAGRRRSTRPAPATCSGPAWSSARCPAGRWPTGSRSPTLCAALSVQQFGGSLAAPGWGDDRRLVAHGARQPASAARTTPR